MIVAGEVAIYALLSYARHARAPSLGRATTEESSPGFETPVVAVRLAKALWQIRPERAWLAAVAEILADQDINDMRRLDAALALAVFRDPLAVSALVRALDDRHSLVRHHAVRALLIIHGLPDEAGPIQHGPEHMMYRVMFDDLAPA